MKTLAEVQTVWKKSQEVEALVNGDKIIRANLKWKWVGHWSLEAGVFVPITNELLSLRANVYRTNRSFVLLYKNRPIRKLTIHHHHSNVDGQVIYGCHKHLWDEMYEDRLIYVPEDIRVGNPDAELMGFLVECKVRLEGTYEQLKR